MYTLSNILNYPLIVLLLSVAFIMLALKFQGVSLPDAVTSLNSIQSQPFALLVLIIGFWMLIECKKFGIDTTIAGGVIGVASNMLQSQIKDAAHLQPSEMPPGSSATQNTVIKAAPEASVTPLSGPDPTKESPK